MLAWLEGSALGYAIRNSGVWTYSILNLAHILGIASLFGAVLVLDLRLLGAWRTVPVAAIARPAVPVASGGFLLAAAAGVCMLATNGTEYASNPFLPLKFAFIGLALINVLVVNQLPAWKQRETVPMTPRGERQLAVAGGISLFCWLGAVTCGRMIGYW